MVNWLYSWTGVGRQANGWSYSFWSGFGSCLTYVGIVAAGWRHLNCHVKGCWRIGRHPLAEGKYKVCAHHHPDEELTARSVPVEVIHAAHAATQGGAPDGEAVVSGP